VLVLVAAVFVLRVSGRGSLRLPPVDNAAAWHTWFAENDATTLAFAFVRVLALGAAWYCVLVTAAGTAARLSRAATLVALVDRVTLPPLRRLLSVTLTAGLATGLAGAAVAATPTTVTPGPAVTVTMHRLPPASAPGAVPPTTTTTTTPSAPTTTTTTVAESAPAPPATPDLAPSPASAPSSTPSSASGRWTVRPGDCFWSIAADVLSRAWGRPAADAEIAPYWRRLVEANRAALVDASNPDLVFPGQVFTLPQP
jgi:hypothetical protein